jgi:ketosteroid isomerase-like protein
MSDSLETQILRAEERLRLAMLGSLVDELNDLLAPGLIFTNHLGQVIGKQEDVSAHAAGLVKVDRLESSERRIQVIGDAAVVTVRMYLSGSYGGAPAAGDFRFTRVWARNSGGTWQVIVGHSSLVV